MIKHMKGELNMVWKQKFCITLQKIQQIYVMPFEDDKLKVCKFNKFKAYRDRLSYASHPFPPLFDEHSRILILGSFPSVKSREEMFFYGHPQNRFWKVVAGVFGEKVPATIPEKREFLFSHGIALWDTIASCEITGSSDSSIRNVTPNDLTPILKNANIQKIFVNGKTSEKYFNRYIAPTIGRSAICLPSTSPANAAWSVERLVEAWKVIAL